MSVATLVIIGNGRIDGKVTQFTLCAPQEVKKHIEQRMKESRGVLQWYSTNKGIISEIDQHVFLSWIEESFGDIQCFSISYVDNNQARDRIFSKYEHLHYVFRRRH